MQKKQCDYEGCLKLAHPGLHVYGYSYCEDHYLCGLEQAFFEELTLPGDREPSKKFRNLFGRYAEALYQKKGEPMPEQLLGNKIRDRAKEIQHHGNTLTFIIDRHPTPIPVNQRWQFDLQQGNLSLISEEPSYLDCNEVAARLGLTSGTVRRYIKQGKLKAQKVSDIEAINYWFEDKLDRGYDDIYIRQSKIISPYKWLVSIDEFHRFKEAYNS
jgi:hypothetical protein